MEQAVYHPANQDRVDYAMYYAIQAHAGQIRKYTEEPYVTHPIAVANLVAGVTDDTDMVVAALLHDVIEDTAITYADLEAYEFSSAVIDLVRGMTQVSTRSDGSRAVRKRMDLKFLAKQSHKVHTIKLADLIHNSESIIAHAPKFAEVYMAEFRALLVVLTGGDGSLRDHALKIIKEYYCGTSTPTPTNKVIADHVDVIMGGDRPDLVLAIAQTNGQSKAGLLELATLDCATAFADMPIRGLMSLAKQAYIINKGIEAGLTMACTQSVKVGSTLL